MLAEKEKTCVEWERKLNKVRKLEKEDDMRSETILTASRGARLDKPPHPRPFGGRMYFGHIGCEARASHL